MRESVEDLTLKKLNNVNINEIVAKIKETGKVTRSQYRAITGACLFGTNKFCEQHNIQDLEEIITRKAEEKIKQELAQRIPEPKMVKKARIDKITYAGRYEIASNFTGRTKDYVINMLRGKKCSELMLIN